MSKTYFGPEKVHQTTFIGNEKIEAIVSTIDLDKKFPGWRVHPIAQLYVGNKFVIITWRNL